MRTKSCKKIVTTFINISVALGVSFGVTAQEDSYEPVYECTADETIAYINKTSYSLYAPSPVTTRNEFMSAYVEAKKKEEEESGEEGSCVTIFTDGSLNEDWKDIVDTIRNIDTGAIITDPGLSTTNEVIKGIVTEELMNALEKLGSDICQFLSRENMEKLALNELKEKSGIDARSLEIEDLAIGVSDLAYDTADDDIQTLLSKDKMEREVRSESREEFTKFRKDLWDNL